MEARWRIELLGTLRATCAGRTLERFRTRRTGCLLAYLALHARPDRPGFTREALARLFWPQSEPAAAGQSLRQALSALRRALQPPEGDDGELLLTMGGRVRLDPRRCVTDVAEFETALAEAAAEEGAASIPRLTRALCLYRGELLPGFGESWVLSERERLAAAYLGAFDRLIALLESAGEREQALQWAHRAVAADPLREESHRHLIRLLVAMGRHEEARRRYEECEQILARDLDAVPDPATTALLAAPLPSAGLGVSSAPLYGREEELRALGALLGSTLAPLAAPGSALRTPRQGNDAVAGGAWSAEHGTMPRLVTLTGPGGGGKTRVALALAARMTAEGRAVFVVPLADLADGRRIPEAIRDTLGLPRGADADAFDAVAAALARRPSLLLLDNMEHLLDEGVPVLLRLLDRVPALTCLVTSRARLHVAAEHEFPVPPLPAPGPLPAYPAPVSIYAPPSGVDLSPPCPPSLSPPTLGGDTEGQPPLPPWGSRQRRPERLGGGRVPAASEGPGGGPRGRPTEGLGLPSLQLFLDRARAARPGFRLGREEAGVVAEICRRLEGLPLSIELAAARAATLSPAAILAGLERPLEFLGPSSGGVGGRHGSLRAALAWSEELLSPDLRRFFARLSVFRGGWSLEAAAAVTETTGSACLEAMERLCEASLVRAVEEGEAARYRFLETVREYAAERLREHGEERAALERHREYFRALLETGAPEPERTLPPGWRARVRQEYENLCAALAGALEAGDEEAALRMGAVLARFWEDEVRWREGWEWVARILARPASPARARARADLLFGAGRLAFLVGRRAEARALHDEGLALRRRLGDREGVGRHLQYLALLALTQEGDPARAETLLQEALAIRRPLNQPRLVAITLTGLGGVAHVRGDYAACRRYREETLAYTSAEPYSAATALSALARLLYEQGEYEEAARRLREGMSRLRDQAGAHGAGAGPAPEPEDGSGGARFLALSEEFLEHLNSILPARAVAGRLLYVARVALELGRLERARALLDQVLAEVRQSDARGMLAEMLPDRGEVARRQGDFPTAERVLRECVAIGRELGLPRRIADALAGLGMVASDRGELERAREYLEESLAYLRSLDQPWPVAVVRVALGERARRAGDPDEARMWLDEGLALHRRLNRPIGIAAALRARARLETEWRSPDAARALWRESACLTGELGDRLGLAECLEGLAATDTRTRKLEEAARRLGAAGALRAAIGAPLPPVERPGAERLQRSLHRRLRHALFTERYAEGAGWSWSAAAADAARG